MKEKIKRGKELSVWVFERQADEYNRKVRKAGMMLVVNPSTGRIEEQSPAKEFYGPSDP